MIVKKKLNITIIIHTENKEKLSKLLYIINQYQNVGHFSIQLNAKGYVPWEDEIVKTVITSFGSYNAQPTEKPKIESIVELISKANTEFILILDEDCESITLNSFDEKKHHSLYGSKLDLLKLNLDTKYQSVKWFIIDLLSQKNKIKIDFSDDSSDCLRYNQKITNPIFYDRIFYIDGGLGDHVMALPLLEKVQDDNHICCKYPIIFEHLQFKSRIDWNDDLFGGYKRFVYEHGSVNNSKTIVDAFFELYGQKRNYDDILTFKGHREKNELDTGGKKIALICSSAAKINNQVSNKDWKEIRWLKLVNELQEKGYYVIQVGSINDNQIPMVDLKFLDQSLQKLVSLIDDCSLWISVDTFFHHLAASIKPEVGICLTPFYNDIAKHPKVRYIEKDCGKDFSSRKWWLDLQQPERKECMDLIQLDDVIKHIPNNDMIIVQLGSNKGYDELTNFIKKNKITFKKGIFVEANPHHIDELKKCYEDFENVYVENIGIKPKDNDPNELEIFYHLNDGPNYEVASLSIDHVAKHHNYDYDNISSFKVKSITLEELLDKHNLTKIDWLLIDVEGIDGEIVENFNWDKYDIKRIDVEHIHFGDKWNDIFEKFYSMGYKHIVANDGRYDVAFEKK